MADTNNETKYPWWAGQYTFANLIHALLAVILVVSLVVMSACQISVEDIKTLVVVVVSFYFGNQSRSDN